MKFYFLFFMFFISKFAYCHSGDEISVNAIIRDESVIEFSVENKSKDLIVLLKSNLPWVDSFLGAEFFAFRNKNEPIPLKKIGALLGSIDSVEIRPGDELVGGINLRLIFPDIINILESEDVFVFWIYYPVDTNGKEYRKSNGMIVLHKKEVAGQVLQ